ncbi:MAG: hypothetical protein H0U66_05655 [Gemmatimonadaceae bacterium]|nr:hypothetical protein [Gemmatimonadaceae bacterium]
MITAADDARAEAVVAAVAVLAARTMVLPVRRLRVVMRLHGHPAPVPHPITGMRQHHCRARRYDREREERYEGTTQGVRGGAGHGGELTGPSAHVKW